MLKKLLSYNIVTSINEKYIKYGVSLIYSIWKNNLNGNIIFTILDCGISSNSKSKLLKWSKKNGIIINFYTVDKFLFNKYLGIDYVKLEPLSYYARLICPYIFESSVEKILYLDADIICLKECREIFNSNLNGSIVAACRDSKYLNFKHKISNQCSSSIIPNYKELGFNGNEFYFNSGVMLIDVILWKKENISVKIINILNKNKDNIILWDQYGLNIILVGLWTELEKKWNTIAHNSTEEIVFRHFAFTKPDSLKYMYNDRKIYFKNLNNTPWKEFPFYKVVDLYYSTKKNVKVKISSLINCKFK